MKRLAALFLGLLLALPFPAAVFADDADTVYVRSVEDWLALAEDCVLDSRSKGKTVVLAADLDFSDAAFAPIPLFAGAFDGGGHTLRGVTVAGAASTAGVFRQVLAGGMVENLNVEAAVVPEGVARNIGGVAGVNYGTLRGCAFTGTVSGSRCVGGVVGSNRDGGTVEACRASGSVDGEHRVGGVAGENLGAVRGCANACAVNTTERGEVTPEAPDASLTSEELLDVTDVGGVAGYSAGTLDGCVNTGAVGHAHIGYNIGGVAGRQAGCTTRCVNEGKVLGRKDVGGVVGQLDPDTAWEIATERVDALRASLSELQRRIDRTLADAESSSTELGASADGVRAAMSRAGDAAEALVNGGEDWINENVAALNELSRRVDDTIDALEPVSRDLSAAAGGASDALTQLDRSLLALEAALSDTRTGFAGASNYFDHLTDENRDRGAPPEAPDDLLPPMRLIGESDEDYAARVSRYEQDMADYFNALLLYVIGDTAELRRALQAFSAASGEAEDSMYYLRQTSGRLSDSLYRLKAAIDKTGGLLKKRGAEEAIRFAAIDDARAAQSELFDALAEVNGAVGDLTGRLADTTTLEDLQAVSDQLFALSELLLDMLADDRGGMEELTEDVSLDGGTGRTDGVVADSVNRGGVEADVNVGGVVGAVTLEVSFDHEDELNLSAALSEGAKYLIYAVVRGCENYAGVTAGKSAAGGVAGRADYGLVSDCLSGGAIKAGGDYAGGIVGCSLGTVRRCSARANLSGGNYVGGVAGWGADILNCCAMPNLDGAAEFRGSVAGCATGRVRENCYAGSAVGGVDGFSFAGEAEQVSYEELLERSGGAELFASITVTFLVEGRVLEQRSVPFGGTVDTLPRVPDRDGRRWVWDEFDRDVYYSIAVDGSYRGPVTSIASGEDVPRFLVEGVFYEGQSLRVADLVPDVSALGLAPEDVLTAATLTVENYGDALTVRMYAEEDGTLYALEDSGLARIDCGRDGSYLVFPLANGGSVVYVRSEKTPVALLAGAAIITATAVAIIVLLLRKRRLRKRRH